MAARYAQQQAPGQQPAYGAQAQQGYGYQDPQAQQAPYDPNGSQYGQDQQQQYGQDDQAPGQDQQNGQDEQEPNGADAPGPKGAKPRVGLDETANHAGEPEEEPAEEHEEVGATEHEPSKAVGAGRRQFSQDPNHHKLMSHFHAIAEHGLTDDHIHSMVHVGSFMLATLAKHTGMTAGHEAPAAGTTAGKPVKPVAGQAKPKPVAKAPAAVAKK
ncbi:hypothetical protein LTR85_004132 [Meristemomyces frigidus]|nr:hypothetical protein LTR85_004132 [Meristemomyces frigidus]